MIGNKYHYHQTSKMLCNTYNYHQNKVGHRREGEKKKQERTKDSIC